MAARPFAWLARRFGAGGAREAAPASALPRRIHGLWLQGLDQAPPLVRRNFERWAALNPTYRLEVLDRAAAEALLAGFDLPLAGMAPQALSDLVRVRRLLVEGGVWVDASTCPALPLDAWAPPLLHGSGVFAFERPGADRLISSWFLCAEPENPIVAAWWAQILRFWSKPRRLVEGIPADPLRAVAPGAGADDTYPYFWLHYLFEAAVVSDPALQARYAAGAHRAAEPCRRLREAMEAGERDPQVLRPLFEATPVHKLDWRRDYPLEVLDRLGEVVGPAGLEPATRPL